MILTVDASPLGIGAILSHRTNQHENPIGYVSRSLNMAERNYSQTELEALAIIFGVLKFQSYLYGHHFTIETDHKPLVGLFGRGYATSKIAAGRITRWGIYLNQFDYNLVYKPGNKISHADTLSRFPVSEPPATSPLPSETIHLINKLNETPVTFQMIAEATKRDKTLTKVMHYTRTSWPDEVPSVLKPYHDRKLELSIQENCLMWGQRVVVPQELHKKILNILHEGHVGTAKMKALSRSFVYWPEVNKNIEDVSKTCTSCQINSKSPAAIQGHRWITPPKPWDRIHLDFAENFRGMHFLVIIDAHSKWIEVYEQARLTSVDTIRNLQRCFATYGLPKQIHSDNGSAFTSNAFDNFMKSLGIKHTTNPAYSPKTNGLAERAVQTFKQKMRKISGNTNERLTTFLMHYRTTVHDQTNRTPASLLFGRELRTKLTLVQPDVENNPIETRQRILENERFFVSGDSVLARDFVSGRENRWKIGEVIERLGRFKYKIRLTNGTTITRHADALKHTRRNIWPVDQFANGPPQKNEHEQISFPSDIPTPSNVQTPRLPLSRDCQTNDVWKDLPSSRCEQESPTKVDLNRNPEGKNSHPMDAGNGFPDRNSEQESSSHSTKAGSGRSHCDGERESSNEHQPQLRRNPKRLCGPPVRFRDFQD